MAETVPAKPAAELPDRYDADRLHLMVRDAHTLFLYWEVSDRRKRLAERHFECGWSVLPKIVRVYDTTNVYFNGNNANEQFDIETTPEAGNWYIHGVRAGATYAADFGTYSLDRQFVPLLRSNFVATPRDCPPEPGEPIARFGLENFSAYAHAARNGVYISDESTVENADAVNARRQRAAHPGPAHASALYPSP
jgi:hypothetical protein